MRTQVGIVGAGPAGLILSHLLHHEGVESVILEARPRAYVEGRVRAGVLEHGTVALLDAIGVSARLHREGLVHDGTNIRFAGATHRIDFRALTGKAITVYGQHEVVKDLIAARLASAGPIVFDAEDVTLHDLDTATPAITYCAEGASKRLVCDVVAGCDGFHGICRAAMPAGSLAIAERTYPFGWLGILAETGPVERELIYANHAHGFALASMRSPHVSRLYLQVAIGDDPADWPDARIWSELALRLGTDLETGLILQKSITPMRSFVAEPMQHGRLYLAGDAAHIVPPTGAKGLNLAAGDVAVLARAIAASLRSGDGDLLARYSETALRRVWRAQRFSTWMTAMLHRFEDATDFDRRIQLAELQSLVTSTAAATVFAENYVGLPFG
jgi:p-hydroxybenzoate 3-monooxygenase